MCGKVTKENKEDDGNQVWHSGCFEMERDTVGQEHIWGSKLWGRLYFLRGVGHKGVFNTIILTVSARYVCAFHVHYTLQRKKS